MSFGYETPLELEPQHGEITVLELDSAMRPFLMLPLLPLFLLTAAMGWSQTQEIDERPSATAEVRAPGDLKEGEAETFHLPFIDPEDRAYYLTLDPNRRALIAVRRELWSYQERMRFEPFQKHHAAKFPDTPVPTSLAELSPKQAEELKSLKIGIQTYTFSKPNDPETSALYASPLFRQSDAFNEISERNRREAQAGRERVDQASRKSRGGRGTNRGVILLIVGAVWGLAFVYKKFVMKPKGE